MVHLHLQVNKKCLHHPKPKTPIDEMSTKGSEANLAFDVHLVCPLLQCPGSHAVHLLQINLTNILATTRRYKQRKTSKYSNLLQGHENMGVSPCQSIDIYISVNHRPGPVFIHVVRILASFLCFFSAVTRSECDYYTAVKQSIGRPHYWTW